MRYVRCALLLAAAATCSACFQFSTVLTVKADGSGTIEQRLLFSQSAVAQLRQFAALSGGAQDFDPLSERQARDAAASLGTGVTYVSSVPIDSTEGVGRDISYAFADINQLSLDQAPPPPGGMAAPQGGGPGERVTFKLTRQPDGHSLLAITLPAVPAAISASSGPSAEQLAMLKPMLAGARLSIEIEPAGTLVRTSSPFVDGPAGDAARRQRRCAVQGRYAAAAASGGSHAGGDENNSEERPEYQTESRSGDHDRVSVAVGLSALGFGLWALGCLPPLRRPPPTTTVPQPLIPKKG